MIYVSELQGRVIRCLMNAPESSLGQICRTLGKTSNSLGMAMTDLVRLGAITRSGVERHYRYSWSGLPYTIGVKPRDTVIADTPADPLIMELTQVNLPADKLDALMKNLHLPRHKLARRLGISKLELNQAMDKYRIKSKFKPKDIDADE